jgi:hypothetical protein
MLKVLERLGHYQAHAFHDCHDQWAVYITQNLQYFNSLNIILSTIVLHWIWQALQLPVDKYITWIPAVPQADSGAVQ